MRGKRDCAGRRISRALGVICGWNMLVRVWVADNLLVPLTADQNLPYQQNLKGRELALLVLGSNIRPVVRNYAEAIRFLADWAMKARYKASFARP